MTRTYTDKFTLDGRVKPVAGVTEAKVRHTAGMVDKMLTGDRVAKGQFEALITTSDLGFNVAHLINLDVLPKFDEATRNWTTIAGTRSVPDFNDVRLYSLDLQWDDRTLGNGNPRHVAPVIPEATAYPEASFTGKSYAGTGLHKRGFRTGFSFEAFVNDSLGYINSLPDAMLEVALDTEEYEVYSALINGVGEDQALKAGVSLESTEATVAPNAPLSRDALIVALEQVSQRVINGRRVQVTGGWNLIVGVGQTARAQWALSTLGLAQITDGNRLMTVNNYNPLAGIDVVESEYVTGASWYLLPKPGASRLPVLDNLRLIGHEAVDLRVQGLAGQYTGGAAVSPYEGSFDADTADFRVRLFTRGNLWNPDLVIWSDGSGTA